MIIQSDAGKGEKWKWKVFFYLLPPPQFPSVSGCSHLSVKSHTNPHEFLITFSLPKDPPCFVTS